jgi:hypothetical protein
MWATFAVSKKLSKVNNHPLGENSLNLATLINVHIRRIFATEKALFLCMYIHSTYLYILENQFCSLS